MTDPLVGHLVDGRYEVVSRIAHGGMATVYLAVDRRLDREVALKIMHAHLADGASGSDFIARFRREARSAARLTHPGLVGVYDQGVDGDTSYLTMEYVDGVNLRHRLAERGSLTVAESLRIIDAVLDALATAHRKGLVHRDIKPENVLLASDERVKVTDFGLARAVTEVTSTTTGTVLGTVAYLGPELVARGVSDARTDVYATGILLYEMLTGHQPFTGQTPIQVAFQHVNNDIPAPSDRVDWLPQEVDELVAALAARDPDDRPNNAAEALELVRRTRATLDPATLARRADVEPRFPADDDADDEAPGDDDPPATQDEPESADDDGAVADALPLASSGNGAGGARSRQSSHSSQSPRPSRPTDSDATARLDLHPAGMTVALPIGTGVRSESEIADEARRAGAPLRRRRWTIAGIAAGVAVVLLAAGTWWWVAAGPGAFTSVPDVVGQQEAVALETLRARGLTAQPGREFSDVAAGSVISTSPGPGGRISKDGTVVVTVSKGKDLRVVPAGLVGKSFTEAAKALRAVGLVAGDPVHAYDDTIDVGDVVSAGAEPGDKLKVDSIVTLTVSDGPAPLDIISVVGATEASAKADLERAGLKMKKAKSAFSDTVEKGRVISQSPEAGSPGHRTDTVKVVISKGPDLVEVPGIRYGASVDAATAVLEAAGFKVETKHALAYLGLNVVLSQTPGGGQKAPRGSVVTLTIA